VLNPKRYAAEEGHHPLVGTGGGRGVMPVMTTRETDDAGRFAFAAVPPGKYQLSAERTGYLRQSYGARQYSGGGTPVLVADGQTVKDIVFKLSPQAVITGKVLDEDGEPVANMQVRAQKYVYRGGKRQWSGCQRHTSDIGEYRLPECSRGRLSAPNPRNPGRNFRCTPPRIRFRTHRRWHTRSPIIPAPAASIASPIDVGPGGGFAASTSGWSRPVLGARQGDGTSRRPWRNHGDADAEGGGRADAEHGPGARAGEPV
jgi:hypothetical protein